MMDIGNILDPRCTRMDVDANSRKRLLEFASDLLAERHGLSARHVFDELMTRERLGSTGLGDGVAIPHCRIDCDRIHGAFFKLGTPVDYDAMDGEPVDLLFFLLVPPEETTAHLEVLAELARVLGDADNRTTLRGARTNNELFETFTGLLSPRAA